MGNRPVSRRAFLGLGLGAAAALALPRGRGARADEELPQFFLHLVAQGGMDAIYTFDARPLAFSAAGVRADYLGDEPREWLGRNGQKTLATRLAAPLVPHRDSFSVLNGVVMSPGFDGHKQNLNFMFTGSPFGGESFVPHLGEAASPALSYLQAGALSVDLSNAGGALLLERGTAYSFVHRLRTAVRRDSADPVSRFTRSRMEANGHGPGRFASASALLGRALAAADKLASDLRALEIARPMDVDDSLEIIFKFFRAGISRAAVVNVGPPDDPRALDTHSPALARKSAEVIGATVSRIAAAFSALKATPYDSRRSMFDVTTVLVSSEFSRTLRQVDKPLDATGTDHNPLTGTLLIGGRGIATGLVVGASDYAVADEPLSPAHLAFDPHRVKIMGRPFEASSLSSFTALPATFAARDYLGMPMVVNTLLFAFGAARERYWRFDRGGSVAPILSGLVS